MIPTIDDPIRIFSNRVIWNTPYRKDKIASVVCRIARTPMRYIDTPPPEKNDAKNITHIERLIINQPEKFGIVVPLTIEYIYRHSTPIAMAQDSIANMR
jgi:hypothetical protein